MGKRNRFMSREASKTGGEGQRGGRLSGDCRIVDVKKMRLNPVAFLILLVLHTLDGTSTAAGQSPDTGWETRPKVTASIELAPRTRVRTWGEFQHGTNFSFNRWRTGAMLSRHLEPILRLHRADIDQENEHYLVFGGGYEYLDTHQDDRTTIENRLFAEVTPQALVATVLVSNRNRGEFRWVNGAYDFRYRNKLVISDRLKFGALRFTPYGSAEIYYDRNHHSWNQSQYGFGVQFPYKKSLMLDTYLIHQNCTVCEPNPVNMAGITLNVYFRQP